MNNISKNISQDELNSKTMKAGTAFGTGRPSTGRTHAITIRISEKAFEYLCSIGNKSAYIDSLIVSKAEENNPLTTNTSS